jgi:hypothetical protein
MLHGAHGSSQVAYAAGGAVVSAFASLDRFLERYKVLPVLGPAPEEKIPEKRSKECAQVHHGLCACVCGGGGGGVLKQVRVA